MRPTTLVTPVLTLLLAACTSQEPAAAIAAQPVDAQLASNSSSPGTVATGQSIFRFDAFGDETFWTDTLRMHEVIASKVDPNTALKVGLKVDATALPEAVVEGIKNNTVDLNSPATTVTLLKLGAVVGVVGKVSADGKTLERVGITCAFCHSTVDNSFSPGIGKRLDGWPNRDLNVGAIISLSPAVTDAQKAVYGSWGPGMYDPRFNIDGKNMPVVIPPAFGLRHVAKEIYTGDGPVSYWNAYVAITQMHGHGPFSDPRIGVNVNNPPDMVTSKLPPLREYQFSLSAPEPIAGTFDPAAAKRGHALFEGKARCARCHLAGSLSDVNAGKLHEPAEVGQSAAYADRSATKKYRTTPLRGLWHAPQLKGPYFHDGSAKTLEAAVEHEAALSKVTLTAAQKHDLVEYLKTL
jgi:mono/diheme cytochrome c family protein